MRLALLMRLLRELDLVGAGAGFADSTVSSAETNAGASVILATPRGKVKMRPQVVSSWSHSIPAGRADQLSAAASLARRFRSARYGRVLFWKAKAKLKAGARSKTT